MLIYPEVLELKLFIRIRWLMLSISIDRKYSLLAMKNKLLIIISWVSFLNVVSPVRIPQNPCPNVFSYYKDSQGLLYGETTVPYDRATYMTLSINASLAARFNNKVELKLVLKTTLKQLMANVSTVTYHIIFPSQEIIPKITEINYNGNVFCRGPPEPLIPGTQGITNVWYSTVFRFTRIAQWNLIEDHQDPGISESEIPVKDPDNIIYTVQKRPTDSTTENNVVPTTSTQRSTVTHSNPTTPKIVLQIPPVTPSTSTVEGVGSSSRCGVPNLSITPLILGGIDTAVGQFPWLVALMSTDDGYKCSATLISDQHVITAARCVQYYRIQLVKTENILLVMGTNDLQNWASNGAVTRRAIKVDVHPDFIQNSNTAHADMSVITMDSRVRFSDLVVPVCLWKGDSDLTPITNKVGRLAGYGQDEEARKNGTLHVSHAKYADMKIISRYVCLLSEYGLSNITSDKTFCAGGANKGPCIGDSGAGFVLPIKGSYHLRGIASFSITHNGTCDFDNKYAVFCDVAKFSGWIESCMRE